MRLSMLAVLSLMALGCGGNSPARSDQGTRSAAVEAPDAAAGRSANQTPQSPPADLIQTQRQAVFEHQHKIDEFAWDGKRFLPDSVERVRALDRIVHEESETVQDPNSQSPFPVRYTKLRFENGLEVSFRTFGTPIQIQFTGLTISSTKWPVNKGLGVGAPLTRVREVLGTPNEASDRWIKYHGETEQVTFFLKNGRVSSVAFDYYAD